MQKASPTTGALGVSMRVLALLPLLLFVAVCHAASLRGEGGKPVVVRGIGWSPWHQTEHWGLSPATNALDRQLLHGAHINTLRSWGEVSPEAVRERLADGLYTIPTFHCREGLKAEFADGSPHGLAPSDPATREGFARQVEQQAGKMAGLEGCLAVLLGNEYSAVGVNPNTKDYQYTGFEAPTQARFRAWLQERFGDIAALNRHCGTNLASFDEVKPLATRRLRYEFWLFQNRAFEAFMRAGHEAAKRAAPDRPTSYAKLLGTHWDPFTEDARLSFLDIGGDNWYWNWTNDWARTNAFLNDLIAAAQGKPVLLTEGGFLSRAVGEARAARLTKQMLWNAFLHPEVAGFCVYAYCDEWYVDGNPDEQTDAESWGIVTADRRPKPSYYAVAEVYAIIEQLNDFFATCQAPPVVAVSNQALGALVEDASTRLHEEIGRVLYASGVSFHSAMPADVHDLDPRTTPRLIFCDSLFDCEPDGSRSALEAFLRYVWKGGQVLYLCPRPWRLVYGEATLPQELRFAPEAPATVRYGRGMIRYLPRDEFTPEELETLIAGFLRDTRAPELLRVTGVTPPSRRHDAFCRLLTSGQRRIVLLVNAGDALLRSVRLTVPGATGARLLYADGASLRTVPEPGGIGLRVSELETYALVEVTQ